MDPEWMNMQCNKSIEKNDRINNISTDATEAMQPDMDKILVKSFHPTHGALYQCEKQMHVCVKIGLILVLLICVHCIIGLVP